MNSGRNEPAMTMQRARALLDAYGSAPDRWPAAERDGARAFIAAEPEARQHAEQARRLDMILDGTETVAPSAGLYARVLAAFDSVAAKPSVRRTLKRIANVVWPEAPLWQPMAALAISLAAGILLGTVSPLGGASQLQATGSDMAVAMDAAPDTDDGI